MGIHGQAGCHVRRAERRAEWYSRVAKGMGLYIAAVQGVTDMDRRGRYREAFGCNVRTWTGADVRRLQEVKRHPLSGLRHYKRARGPGTERQPGEQPESAKQGSAGKGSS